MILIIGATGTVGSETVRRLSSLKIPVRALIHSPEKAVSITSPGVETVVGDLDLPYTLEKALDGITRAFLVSPLHQRQVELQGNFVKAAQRAGNVHIVKLSGLGTSLDSPILSGLWHAQIEKQLVDSGLSFTFLRPPFFMQNFLSLAPSISENGFFECCIKDGRVAMVDARDVAAVAVVALTKEDHRNKVYSISGPEALSHHDVAEEISSATGKAVSYRIVSPESERKQLLKKGLPEWHVDLIVQFHTALSEGLASEVVDTVKTLTGKAPRSFDQFAREYSEVFRGS